MLGLKKKDDPAFKSVTFKCLIPYEITGTQHTEFAKKYDTKKLQVITFSSWHYGMLIAHQFQFVD